MSVLQKGYCLGSFGAHVILAILVTLGVGFIVPQKQEVRLPELRIVPSRLVDDLLAGGGGNPNLKPDDSLPAPALNAAQPAEPIQVRPKPEPPSDETAAPPGHVEPAPTPAPASEVRRPPKPSDLPKKPPAKKPLDNPPAVKNSTTKPQPEASPPASKDTKPKPNLGEVIRRSESVRQAEARKAAEGRARAAAEAKARLEREQVQSALRNLGAGLSKGTKVEVGGTGGEAYANYSSWVRQRYDDAWTVSDSMTDDSLTVEAKVKIARNGDVLSAVISRRSGNSALDRSVQNALDKVKNVAPFPAGANELERTFIIEFNLKTKRSSG